MLIQLLQVSNGLLMAQMLLELLVEMQLQMGLLFKGQALQF